LKIKVLSERDNPLLRRREVVFSVDHSKEGLTPSRLELRKKFAELLKTKMELVYVEEVKTKTGETTSIGEVNAYESPERAELVERRHIILRNTPPKAPEKQEKPVEQRPSEESKEEEVSEEREKVDEKKPSEGVETPENKGDASE
jgi:small subunit ribosomal protein S24e